MVISDAKDSTEQDTNDYIWAGGLSVLMMLVVLARGSGNCWWRHWYMDHFSAVILFEFPPAISLPLLLAFLVVLAELFVFNVLLIFLFCFHFVAFSVSLFSGRGCGDGGDGGYGVCRFGGNKIFSSRVKYFIICPFRLPGALEGSLINQTNVFSMFRKHELMSK